jgi:uncharacterized protein YjbI with pentapeptide repeats
MLPKKKNLSRLVIFRKKSKEMKITNKFYSKAFCYKAIFSNVKFINVNFKGAILTNCSFKNSSFFNVEFLGTNLKNSNFSGAIFKNCIFSATLLKNVNFKNTKFENCIFVSVNFNVVKNLELNTDINQILSTHNLIPLNKELEELFNKYKFHQNLQNSRVLYLKSGKLNSLTVNMIMSNLGEKKCKQGLINLEKNLSSRIVTSYQLCSLIDKSSSYKV